VHKTGDKEAQEAALALGIDIRTISALASGMAALVATIGGFFLAAKKVEFDITLGNAALLAFPAIILGGLDSIPGAVVGGIIIGIAEVVIGGYTEGERDHFGALVLGVYANGVLQWAGNVGTGFDRKMMERIYGLLQPLIVKKPLFTIDKTIASKTTWTRPAFQVTATGFEVTMYLGTQARA